MLLLLSNASDMFANVAGIYGSEVLTNEVSWFTSTRMENQNMYNIFTDVVLWLSSYCSICILTG